MSISAHRMLQWGWVEKDVGWQDPVFFIREIKKESCGVMSWSNIYVFYQERTLQRCREVLSLHTDGPGSPKSCLMGVGATGAWLLVHASCGEPTLSVPTSPPVVVTTTRSW